ncbi:ATP-binding protein [Emcibacter sp. SYSU 3D8]|uniref:sensor histidine kinase n=1 Tax=Emcibacter sp. SYSU 3D8 TaxID=3133969 RepID=UPI0031FE698E
MRKVFKGWGQAAPVLPVAALVGLVLAGYVHLAHAVLLVAASAPAAWLLLRASRTGNANVEARPDGKMSAAAVSVERSVIDVLPDALVLLDASRRVVEANAAARELFGVRLVGRDFSQVLRHPSAIGAMDRVLSSKAVSREEITLLSPGERHFMLAALPIEGERPAAGEAMPAMAIALHEITTLKRSEQLRADFVANASHELRTPLASIIGFIETLQGPARGDPAAQDRFLEIMALESARMARLIDDLLSLSRIELDEHVVPSDSVDLAHVIDGVVEALSLAARDREMSIAVDIDAGMPAVVGDSDQLTQVFQNLVDNAIKYARIGTAIRIDGKQIERLPETGGPGVVVRVTNDGEGIAREHLPRLTDRFYRVDPARSRQKGGTGLGLAIAKHIVNRHRGRLVLESELGVGTTVSVYLPARAGSQNAK